MAIVSLSYRRSDSLSITGRLFDRLVQRYGPAAVFRDVDNIPPGVDFRRHIEATLGDTVVLLVVIGRKWRGAARGGPARIFAEDDPVRVEVETALRRNLTVIPVLVEGARMPKASQLPDSLEPLSYLHAVSVNSNEDFHHHADRLAAAIDAVLRNRKAMPVAAEAAVAEGAGRAPERARPEWGGYSRDATAELAGSYLVLLPAFKRPGHIVAYETEIEWDETAGGLIFQERRRADAKYAHRGHVQIPNLSMYVYLVSGANGWLRSVTLSILGGVSEIHGILSTLHNVAGAMCLPMAAPVVYLKRERLEPESLGEIAPGHPWHERYAAILRRALDDSFVKLVQPG